MPDKASANKKKKMMIIIGASVLVVVIAVGRKINIPGLTPKKKATAKSAPKVAPKPFSAPKAKVEPPKAVAEKPTETIVDKQGAIKLAEVWNELPVPELIAIVETWKPSEIAPVLNEMDSEKAAEVMAKMKPKQASDVSRELKRIASIVPVTAE
ncbi:MAG: hypothetical protein LW628_10735 [Fimbriimonadaceae bacterium]|nr:hypothetical protein [Fimbriimonadaceae bacterium]